MGTDNYSYLLAGSLRDDNGAVMGQLFYVAHHDSEGTLWIGSVAHWYDGMNPWSATTAKRWCPKWAEILEPSRTGFKSRKEATIWLQGVTDAQSTWFANATREAKQDN